MRKVRFLSVGFIALVLVLSTFPLFSQDDPARAALTASRQLGRLSTLSPLTLSLSTFPKS